MTATSSEAPLRHGGQVLADQLRILGAERLFCVPGESFLGLLDGLWAHRDAIDVVTCRQEGGAANMAEATAKLTGRPGLCAVTRGPGATNASNGIHTAMQDSTPMILFVGQVGRSMRDREAFQEVDYRAMFAPLAKWAAEIDSPERIPEYVGRAWALCQSGRPGPVVLALPEDVLSAEVRVADLTLPAAVARSAPRAEDMERLGALLAASRRPLLAVGGPGWSREAQEAAEAFGAARGIPVATTFRCQDYVDNRAPCYVGTLGIGPVPALARAVREACDLLIAVGARLTEMETGGYTLIDVPEPRMPLVHVHPSPDLPGQTYRPTLAMASAPEAFLAALARLPETEVEAGWSEGLRAAWEAFRTPPPSNWKLDMAQVIAALDARLDGQGTVTNGAGNYAVWLHRFLRYGGKGSQLAPTSGSMGYGLPAAIAAKRARPDRPVVCLAGDGCFLMTAQELATAAQHEAAPVVIVVDNGMYGTIRMHQERTHPGRVIATALQNPDFVAFAGSFGIPGERVEETAGFAPALDRALASDRGYLIHLVVDPEALTPVQTLSEARAQGEGQR